MQQISGGRGHVLRADECRELTPAAMAHVAMCVLASLIEPWDPPLRDVHIFSLWSSLIMQRYVFFFFFQDENYFIHGKLTFTTHANTIFFSIT